MTPFCNFDINYPPMKQKGCCHLVCAGMKFAQQFSRPGKSLETGDEVWKKG